MPTMLNFDATSSAGDLQPRVHHIPPRNRGDQTISSAATETVAGVHNPFRFVLLRVRHAAWVAKRVASRQRTATDRRQCVTICLDL
jgi:hypothetical protein